MAGILAGHAEHCRILDRNCGSATKPCRRSTMTGAVDK
jgi:hypothetical protein